MSAVPSSENDGSKSGLTLLAPGTLFHQRYEVLRCIGTGGMGAVYEVLQLSTRRRRALKTMLPSLLNDAGLRARFALEATITADIDSEHIVEVFDAGFDESTASPFLLMELLKGENLARFIHRQGPMPPRDVVLLLHQASLALDRTHAAGIVHRDLKPENLFLTQRDDGSPRVKLLDFGIAKVIAQSANLATTRSLGTPLYMSPEQIRGDGQIDGRADQYSLGQIAFSLLVGHAYWEPEIQDGAGLYGILLKVVEGARDLASARASKYQRELPNAFDTWFKQATHPLPEMRFDTAGALVESLAMALDVGKTETAAPSNRLVTSLGPRPSTLEVQQSTLVGVSAYQTASPRIAPKQAAARADTIRAPWRLLLAGTAIVAIAIFVVMSQWQTSDSSPARASASAMAITTDRASVVQEVAGTRKAAATSETTRALAADPGKSLQQAPAKETSAKELSAEAHPAKAAAGIGGNASAPNGVSHNTTSRRMLKATETLGRDYDPSDKR